MTMLATKTPPAPPKPFPDDEHDTLRIEGGGITLTLTLDTHPNQFLKADAWQQHLGSEAMRVWWAATAVKQYGKVIL